jgi:hypothetical protein
LKFTRAEISNPVMFVPNVGFTFKPGATIKWTDGFSFWTVTKVNSLGFADAEPVLPKPKDTFRIVVVGDSFVEGLQVPVAEKLQTRLAEGLREKYPDRKWDVVALGMAGAGQANELPFYERSRRDLLPDLVVLVFVNNDFADNSALLSAIRYGWDPDKSPRPYFRPDCTRTTISPDWHKSLLPAQSAGDRVKLLGTISPALARTFSNWSGEAIDSMFYSPGEMPPVFEDAIASTKCAFAEWKRLSEADGFSLLVVATEHVETEHSTGQIDRLKAILDELGLPLLNLHREFARHRDRSASRWKFDGHWTPTGHQWAADAILSYLKKHQMLNNAP